MKNALRKIIVSGNNYLWKVANINANYVCLSIWCEGQKAFPFARVRYRFDDPWIYFGELILSKEPVEEVFQLKPIKPKVVAEIIQKIHEHSAFKFPPSKSLHFEIRENGGLAEVDNATDSGKMPF